MLRRAGRVARSLVGRAVALGGAAIVAYSPPGIAVCVANPSLEKEELEKLLELSSIPKAAIHDLERVKLASITRYCPSQRQPNPSQSQPNPKPTQAKPSQHKANPTQSQANPKQTQPKPSKPKPKPTQHKPKQTKPKANSTQPKPKPT